MMNFTDGLCRKFNLHTFFINNLRMEGIDMEISTVEQKERKREYRRKWRTQNENGRKIRYEERAKYYAKVADGVNSRKLYCAEDIILIMAKQISDEEIAKKLGRSLEAIEQVRTRLTTGNNVPKYIKEMNIGY